MVLDYVSLALLLIIFVLVFYGALIIHDIPYHIARKRHHPHQDAIAAAGWVSLFTLHALWPLLWIWAMAYRPDRGWGFSDPAPTTLLDLEQRVAALERDRTPNGTPR